MILSCTGIRNQTSFVSTNQAPQLTASPKKRNNTFFKKNPVNQGFTYSVLEGTVINMGHIIPGNTSRALCRFKGDWQFLLLKALS